MHTSNEKKPNRITKARAGKRQATSASEILPAPYTSDNPLPPSVVYSIGNGLQAPLPYDPDIDPPSSVVTFTGSHRKRFDNGLTPRADCMARLVARGVGMSDAYRAAYSVTGAEPRTVSQRAAIIGRHARFTPACEQYREAMERRRQQGAIPMRSFVTGRLVHEAQTADNAPSRIRALELLGKTEAMFTDVKRTERAINPNDLDKLKNQLHQRLSAVLQRLGVPLSHDTGTGDQAGEAEKAGGLTAPGGQPPYSERVPPSEKDTIPPTGSPILTTPPIYSGTIQIVPAPGGAREMEWEDL